MELGDYDYRGITAYNWPNPRPRYYRQACPHYRVYRGNPVVAITVQLSGVRPS